eukprot:m.346796 g.346796  ORF g.346796 m.346796 type:complete len:308 (+) comp19862_c0_seq31:1598-2521(+)
MISTCALLETPHQKRHVLRRHQHEPIRPQSTRWTPSFCVAELGTDPFPQVGPTASVALGQQQSLLRLAAPPLAVETDKNAPSVHGRSPEALSFHRAPPMDTGLVVGRLAAHLLLAMMTIGQRQSCRHPLRRLRPMLWEPAIRRARPPDDRGKSLKPQRDQSENASQSPRNERTQTATLFDDDASFSAPSPFSASFSSLRHFLVFVFSFSFSLVFLFFFLVSVRAANVQMGLWKQAVNPDDCAHVLFQMLQHQRPWLTLGNSLGNVNQQYGVWSGRLDDQAVRHTSSAMQCRISALSRRTSAGGHCRT